MTLTQKSNLTNKKIQVCLTCYDQHCSTLLGWWQYSSRQGLLQPRYDPWTLPQPAPPSQTANSSPPSKCSSRCRTSPHLPANWTHCEYRTVVFRMSKIVRKARTRWDHTVPFKTTEMLTVHSLWIQLNPVYSDHNHQDWFLDKFLLHKWFLPRRIKEACVCLPIASVSFPQRQWRPVRSSMPPRSLQ